jgi:prepilin-type N-terminal cleavage/methylation domain-containing protein
MTLIEILVVLVLIGVVLGIVGGNFIGKGEKAKADAAKIEISQIAQTLDLYKLEIGHYPTTQEGLQALISAPAGVTNWNGPYWKRSTCRRIRGATSTNTFLRRRLRLTRSSRSAPTARRAETGPTKTSRAFSSERSSHSVVERRAASRERGRDAARAPDRAVDHGDHRRNGPPAVRRVGRVDR